MSISDRPPLSGLHETDCFGCGERMIERDLYWHLADCDFHLINCEPEGGTHADQ